ncbi:hypothetical protein [Gryllotalpicola koreensis]|uniref:Uncharacterized protein n=1 Tax=Gryllotalpicola koreensis TaxID=993086 RepID=A0ABP8A2C0_9MICO
MNYKTPVDLRFTLIPETVRNFADECAARTVINRHSTSDAMRDELLAALGLDPE